MSRADEMQRLAREANASAIGNSADRIDRLTDTVAELSGALQDTLNMLRAAHMQCGAQHDSNKRVIKAREILAKAERD